MPSDFETAPKPDVHVEDQGPPDEYGRVEAIVRFDGVPVVRMQYAAWPEHLVIYETVLFDDAPEDALGPLMDVLLDLYPERTPPRLTHSAVHSMSTMSWYANCHLSQGLLICGSYGSRTLFYDPLSNIDLSVAPEPMMEGFDALTLTVMFIGQLEDFGQTKHPTLEDAWRWIEEAEALGRFAAIRRLAVEPDVDPEVRRKAILLALLNENSGVRQFAAIHLGGYFPELEVRADVGALCSMMGDPYEIWRMFDREPDAAWNAFQGRRNARYALAWTLGNICWNALGWGAQEWAQVDAVAVRESLEESAAAFTPERDVWLFELALAEFNEATPFAFGTDQPVDLFDFLRFSALRWQMVVRLGMKSHDRFYWLVNTSDGIVGPGPAGDPDEDWTPLTPAGHMIYAPPPRDDLPDVAEMPPWMKGTNHYDLYAATQAQEDAVG